MKIQKLKKLWEGFIWFLWDHRAGTYTGVQLATKPNQADGNKAVPLKMHRLGAWKKIRLWAEVLE
jgi:hypothetical protein